MLSILLSPQLNKGRTSMIVKKLRMESNWSQDQLATMSGLSTRTIQRIEAGHSASNETLKSLASVFNLQITQLTEEITVIDKTTERWQSVPLWVTSGIWGIKTRKTALKFEYLCAAIGIIGLVGAFFSPPLACFSFAWGSAYWYAAAIRWLDNENLW